jgi:L-threonylcarbamoyladenylate synthase
MAEFSRYREAARVIKAGGVIAFRTDTFYGLGADPLNATAVRRIWELKGREAGKPILLLISDREQVSRFVSAPSSKFYQLATSFWPGPLTLVGAAHSNLPEELTAGTGTIGLRLPDDDRARSLLNACGGALTATSANPSSQAPARNASDVQTYFGDQIDLILDDGETESNAPSTVVDATGSEARVVREGLITRSELAKWLAK